MQLILKPHSHPDLDEIIVTSNLFSVGRQEAPFSGYQKSVVAKLSKRHARLFTQDGRLYLADLGSLNGTECNSQPVQNNPRAIDNGDILSFGGLSYAVEIISLPDPTANDKINKFKLVLMPETLQEQLEPIVISSFPFLINKNSEVFERYLELLPKELSYLSRRHAHIFILNDALCIEDLGSTNGTFVNGVALDEHVRTLDDGDLIAFGSDKFVYRAHILSSEESEATLVPDTSMTTGAPARTIFVDSPTSFIDVYFIENNAPNLQSDGKGESENSAGDPVKKKQPSLFQQLKLGLFGDRIFTSGIRRGILLALAVAAIGGGYYYWQGKALRELNGAMDREDYVAALRIANDMLAEKRDNKHLRQMATEAMTNYFIPRWAGFYRQGNFAASREELQMAKVQGNNNSDDDEFIELLEWSTDIHEFILNRNTASQPDPFVEADQIAQQLSFWLIDTRQHTRELGRINQLDSDTNLVYADIFADIRTLRNLDLDAQALRKVSVSLAASLKAHELTRTRELINQFSEEHADHNGVRLLRTDLETYTSLDAAINAKRWLMAADLVADPGFLSAPFIAHVNELKAEILPSDTMLSTYERALSQWRDGQYDNSEADLISLKTTKWRELADTRLDKQQSLRKDLQALLASQSQADYANRLFTFYARLDPSDDGALVEQLRPEFLRYSQTALEQADANLRNAKTNWDRYQQAGRIQTELRLETSVSKQFSQLATYLKSCADNLVRSGRIYDQLNQPRPKTWKSLYKDLQRELSVQRSSLTNLEVVPFAVRQNKLEQLPNLPKL